MKSIDRKKIASFLGLICLVLVMGFGVAKAYLRGANDFSVFFEAWRLVLSGRGADIYKVSPDRFLYSPGFAWLLAPLGILPIKISLGFWCLFKGGVIFLMLKKLSELWKESKDSLILTMGMSSWGILLVARPLLIDLEYGQVNLFIVGACFWGLWTHFKNEGSSSWNFWSWFFLTFAAIAKLFPLPLLIVPWIVTLGMLPRKLRAERLAVVSATCIAFLIPVFSQGFVGAGKLVLEWKEAVLAKGLPLESHNQSFIAFLYHYLSGEPTRVIAEGSEPLSFGISWLSSAQIGLLSFCWTTLTMGVTLGWIVSGSSYCQKLEDSIRWSAIAIALLIVPSHLVWKPYFVMSLPLAIFIFRQRVGRDELSFRRILPLVCLFAAINLTGFDFVGHQWAAYFESASLLLIAHIAMICTAARA